MRSSREQVMLLIRRWQSENCTIKFVFITKDQSLEITIPPIYRASLDPLDDFAFWLQEEPRGNSFHGTHVKLTAEDGYEVINMREAHPTFETQTDIRTTLKVPLGESGILIISEMEKIDPKKVM